MLILQLPSMADEAQLRAVVGILEEIVPPRFARGVQVIRKWHDGYADAEHVETLVNTHIPEGYVNSLHVPISSSSMNPALSLDHRQSQEMLANNLALAEHIRARSIIVHPGIYYYHPDARNLSVHEEAYRWRAEGVAEVYPDRLAAMYRTINTAAMRDESRVLISAENMPFPVHAPSVDDPTLARFNPYFLTCKQLLDYVQHVREGAGLCMDTAHYIRTYDTLIADPRAAEGLEAFLGALPPGLSREDFAMPLSSLTEQLLATGRLFDIQLAESIGWRRGGKKPKSFSLPDGSHQEEIRRLIAAVRDYAISDDTAISLDIDEEDYLARPRQRASLQYLVDLLERH